MTDTAVIFPFADGVYRFWLPMPQAIELERATGAAVFDIYNDLLSASATGLSVRETIIAGLIGGGSAMVAGNELTVGPSRARWLVDRHVYPAAPLSRGYQLAVAIMHAAIAGIRLPAAARSSSKGKAKPFEKGQVISNAGAMHLDWKGLSIGAYLEALHAHNASHADPGASNRSPVDTDRLRRFVNAHKGDRAEMLASVVAARSGK